MRKMNIIKNKILSSACVCVATLALAGCSLLDVSPRMRKESEEFLNNEEGFEYALTGVYTMLAGSNAYGQAMTYQMPEWLVRHFSIGTDKSSDNYIFSNYDFGTDRGDGKLSNAWTSLYKAILQVNDMIEKIGTTEAVFSSPEKRKIIEGELYALRGFIHLEILRFWGPAPSTVEQDGSDKAVPYVTIPTLDVMRLSTKDWRTVVDAIVSDLSRAEELLSTSDPIRVIGAPNSDKDSWLTFRQNSMNYFAVLGAKARLYWWVDKAGYAPVDPATGTNDAAFNAQHYASAVVYGTQVNPDGTESGGSVFQLLNWGSIPTNSYTLYGECLFALDVRNLQNWNGEFNKTVSGTGVNREEQAPARNMDEPTLRRIYEYETHGMYDMRYTAENMWTVFDYSEYPIRMIFRKYTDHLDPDEKELTTFSENRNQIPMIRLSEMYLILMEYAGIAEASTLFETYRLARSMSPSVTSTFAAERLARIQLEYEKEFYGEGQFFYFCKRNALPIIPIDNFILPRGISSYKIPMPKSQSDYDENLDISDEDEFDQDNN